MKRTKQEKGITLVALIITIIVLLILAVVAIRAVTGDGIIAHAKNAQTGYEDAQAKEESILSYYNEYLETKGNIGPWIQNGNKIFMTNSNGETIELKIGDIVNYSNETGKEIEVKSQTFSANSYNEGWKVLGVENGKILLVSSNKVSDFSTEAGQMYGSGEEDLNKICDIYKNDSIAELARSINVDDVNKITGYNPETMPNGQEEGTIGVYGNVITYTAETDEEGNCIRITFTATKSSGGTVTVDGEDSRVFVYFENDTWNVLNEGTKIFANSGYSYAGSEIMSQTYNKDVSNAEEYKLIFNDLYSYWLASKLTFTQSKASSVGYYNIVYFGLRVVGNGKVTRTGSAGDNHRQISHGVRAVVALKPDIELVAQTTENGVTTWNIQ